MEALYRRMRMTYKQTLEYLFSALPMYQRIGNVAIKKDLHNIRALCEMLENPQETFPVIHVAGTNGKGSTSHMLAAVFQSAGKKTGLYTSPHYVDFRERIKVDGKEISKQAVIRFTEKYKGQFEKIRPSFFEITVAMSFDFFRKEKVDIAIIETGLGGRLDSTNILSPLMSVITNIGFDHMQMLGDTLPAIAFEKAGIIKSKVPVVIGEWHKATAPVFKTKAAEMNAPIYFASKHIHLEKIRSSGVSQVFHVLSGREVWFDNLTLGLLAGYQRHNLVTVLEVLYRWNRYYPEEKISDRAIRRGIKNVKTLTNMMGRWMVLGRRPLVITDAAHNEEGIKGIMPELLRSKAIQRHFVLGVVSDKDARKMLSIFPKDGLYYWCKADIPRSKPATELQQEGVACGLKGEAYKSVAEAYVSARAAAGPGDMIFVGGSSYVVGDFLGVYGEHNS